MLIEMNAKRMNSDLKFDRLIKLKNEKRIIEPKRVRRRRILEAGEGHHHLDR
jgi:hypothetical protein